MYDIEKLRTLLTSIEYRTVNENGQCFPPSNDVYNRISITIVGNPSSKHIYTIVKNNRSGLYKAVVDAFEIRNMSTEVNADKSFDPNASTITGTDKFEIALIFNEWKKIKSIETTYEDGRNYLVLQSGWIDLLAEKILIQHRIPCLGHLRMLKKEQQHI
ncbi:hypothetical protein P5V15_007031 [Pogonomyrmex californicus]